MGQQRNQRWNLKISKTNENGNITFQNLWNTAKAVLRGKFIAIHSYLKKQKKHQIENLTLYLKILGRDEEEKKKTPKLVEGKKP